MARRPVRVVYLGHSAALSGAEIALLRLLDAQTVIAPVVVLGEDGPLVAELRTRGVPVRVMPLPSPAAAVDRGTVATRELPAGAAVGAVAYTIRLARALRRIAPDVVHTNSMKAHLYGGVAARLARIPHVWHARDRAAPDYLPPQALGLVRLAARVLPAAVIANSHCTLRTYPGVRNGHVIYDCAPAHRRRSHPPAAPLRVGVVGRLAPWKGQHVFLRAFAAAFGDGDAQAVLVGGALFGEREYAAHLRGLAVSLGLAGRVELTGHTNDVAAQLDRLHILVHCSTIPEPFGQVVVEGMAAGLPVIAADAGGPAELIDHGRTGLLCRPGDVEALAATLKRLAADPPLRASLGATAKDSSQRFAPTRSAEQITTVQCSVATEQPHDTSTIRRYLRGPVMRLRRGLRDLRSRLHPCPTFVLGHQKSGTSVMTTLLARMCDKTAAIDLGRDIDRPAFPDVHSGRRSFSSYRRLNRYEFSHDIIKEANLTPLCGYLFSHYPASPFVFIVRDPRDTIRSILQRLDLPGDPQTLRCGEWRERVSAAWALVLDGRWLGIDGDDYVESLARRWQMFAEIHARHRQRFVVVRYEDFVADKVGTIERLAQDLGYTARHDISGLTHVQHQRKGDHGTTWSGFYGGTERVRLIEDICRDGISSFGYPATSDAHAGRGRQRGSS